MRLFEFVNTNVFHGTDLEHAEHILKGNCIYAKDPLGKKDTTYNDPSKVSFTRNFGVGFTYAGGDHAIGERNAIGVVLCFDLNKLKQKYGKRMQPVEMMYAWGDEKSSDDHKWGKDADAIYKKYSTVKEGNSPEIEDGIWIDKIPNVNSYITEIIVIGKEEILKKLNKAKFPNIFNNPKTSIKVFHNNYTNVMPKDRYDKSNQHMSKRQFDRYSKDATQNDKSTSKQGVETNCKKLK